MAKQKTITYHVSHSFVDSKGNEITFGSQLYRIGVYGIINNNPTMQGCFTPQQIAKIEKNLNKQKENGEIKDLNFGRQIKVTNVNGFWEEVV